jgi:hypothetical protein
MPSATPVLPGLVRSPLVGPATGWGPYLAARPPTRAQPRQAATPGFTGLISVSQQSTYPPRVAVAVTGILASSTQVLTVYRLVAGARTAVRGGVWTTDNVTDSFTVVDSEQPFGVPVRYVAAYGDVLGNITEITSDPITLTITKPVLTDAITGQAAEVTISAWPEKTRSRAGSAMVAGGRQIVVSGPRSTATSTLELYTEFDSVRANLSSLLSNATSGIVQLRSPGGYSVDDAYLAVLSDTEHRWSQDGTDQRRTWSLEVVEVEGWPSVLTAKGYTLADLSTRFATYGTLQAAYGTYLDLAVADLGA